MKSCPFPCATCDASLNCLTCYGGYSISGTSCVESTSCNSGATCTSCPLGYVLNAGTCTQCTATSCLRCNIATPTLCTLCSSSTYLETSTNLCVACTSPCSSCQTSEICTNCVDGYFMQTLNNLATGTCLSCDSNCATCTTSPTYCLSCPTGSTLNGVKCLSNQNVGFDMVFKSPTTTNATTEYTNFMAVIEDVRLAIAGQLGTTFVANPDLISFKSINSGSVLVSGYIDTSSSSSANAVAASTSNIQNNGGYVGFSLLSSTYVSNGFTSSSSSSVNLPLVLGIAIPVGILFIVVAVVIIVKLKKRANAIKEVEKVDDVVISPQPENYQPMEQNETTANNLKPELKKEMGSTNNEAFS